MCSTGEGFLGFFVTRDLGRKERNEQTISARGMDIIMKPNTNKSGVNTVIGWEVAAVDTFCAI